MLTLVCSKLLLRLMQLPSSDFLHYDLPFGMSLYTALLQRQIVKGVHESSSVLV